MMTTIMPFNTNTPTLSNNKYVFCQHKQQKQFTTNQNNMNTKKKHAQQSYQTATTNNNSCYFDQNLTTSTIRIQQHDVAPLSSPSQSVVVSHEHDNMMMHMHGTCTNNDNTNNHGNGQNRCKRDSPSPSKMTSSNQSPPLITKQSKTTRRNKTNLSPCMIATPCQNASPSTFSITNSPTMQFPSRYVFTSNHDGNQSPYSELHEVRNYAQTFLFRRRGRIQKIPYEPMKQNTFEFTLKKNETNGGNNGNSGASSAAESTTTRFTPTFDERLSTNSSNCSSRSKSSGSHSAISNSNSDDRITVKVSEFPLMNDNNNRNSCSTTRVSSVEQVVAVVSAPPPKRTSIPLSDLFN